MADEQVVITITRTIGTDADHLWLDTTGNPDLIEVLGILEAAKQLLADQQH